MKHSLLLFMLFGFSSVFGQIGLGTYGAQQVFGAVTTLGREVVRAAEYKKTKQEQEQREAEYNAFIQQGDLLFDQGQYREAAREYNQALSLKQEQYPRDQVARCNAEIARIEREAYQLLIDKADSSYARLNFQAAIDAYTEALTQKDVQYPKDRIKEVKADQERWKKVHFSGLLISDTRTDGLSSKAFGSDPYSDFMAPGKYPQLSDFLLFSTYQTLDGIAVPANVHLVIYSEPNFKGKVLADVTGPAIINNSSKMNNPASAEAHKKEFNSTFQTIFPFPVRSLSVNDMTGWSKGSMEISTL